MLCYLLILQDNDDKEGGIDTLGARVTALEKRNDSAHLCANYKGLLLWRQIFRVCPNFTSADCAYSIDNECYNIEANHDKVQRTCILLPCFYLAYEATGLRASEACEQSKQKHWLVKRTSGERFSIGKSLPKRSGMVPLGCQAEIN